MNRESQLVLPIGEFLSISGLSDFTGRLHENNKQIEAWNVEFQTLLTALEGYDGTIIFEYGIPGLKKVIDAVLLIGQTVFVVEFKTGADKFETAHLAQTMGYALRLKYFHSESNTHEIVPILVASENNDSLDLTKLSKLPTEEVYKAICCNGHELRSVLDHFLSGKSTSESDMSWQRRWCRAVYNPSPSIIEAIVDAWNRQNVSGLSQDDVDEIGKENHLKAESEILDIIKSSKKNGKKAIVFVTGVPGAGKTLVGLNTSIKAQQYGASMLSGNGPLVEVLTEALKRNLKRHDSKDIKNEIAIESIIRQVYIHKNEVIGRMDCTTVPYTLKKDASTSFQHVIIYDEAQRAWSRDKMISHTSRLGKKTWQNQDWQFSEPEVLMWDLAQLDWGVMVCLIGGGQEINRGEAGINEWIRAIRDNQIFKDWDVYMASELTSPEYNTLKIDGSTIAGTCDNLKKNGHNIIERPSLHLKECQRTTRAKGLSHFINLVVEGKATADDYAQIRHCYRIYLTRDINKAKQHLCTRKAQLLPRVKVDSSDNSEIRTGVLLSSKAKRMRPIGYEVKKESEYRTKTPSWFLDLESESIDSSDRHEVALTEFLVQGLELDLSLVLWDADFRYCPKKQSWCFYSCGTKSWTRVTDKTRQFYMRNAYRVLLTRARSEMIIYVPEGTDSDHTRTPSLYNSTFDYLHGLGLDLI